MRRGAEVLEMRARQVTQWPGLLSAAGHLGWSPKALGHLDAFSWLWELKVEWELSLVTLASPVSNYFYLL